MKLTKKRRIVEGKRRGGLVEKKHNRGLARVGRKKNGKAKIYMEGKAPGISMGVKRTRKTNRGAEGWGVTSKKCAAKMEKRWCFSCALP